MFVVTYFEVCPMQVFRERKQTSGDLPTQSEAIQQQDHSRFDTFADRRGKICHDIAA
jgi:hypothetical protein